MEWWADNLADVAVVGLILISALFAFFRGFVRDYDPEQSYTFLAVLEGYQSAVAFTPRLQDKRRR